MTGAGIGERNPAVLQLSRGQMHPAEAAFKATQDMDDEVPSYLREILNVIHQSGISGYK